MKKIYFLDGLGSNQFYIEALKKAFYNNGIHLSYLALPGHPGNLDCEISNASDLVSWFENQVMDDNITLMGFSLGADLAAFLTTKSQKIGRLILLDGAVTDFTKYPLEKELEAADKHIDMMVLDDLEAYLAEQALQTTGWSEALEKAERISFTQSDDGKYRLSLNKEIVLNLLRIRHEAGTVIATDAFQTPTLVILAEKPEQSLVEKQHVLSRASKEYVSSLVLKGTTHQLYLEAPEKIVLATRFFLDAF